PGPVADRLRDEMVLSPDPGYDVIDLERRLRGIAAELADEIERGECRLALTRTATLTSPTPWWSWAAWRQWRSVHHERTAAILVHTSLTETYEQTRGLQQQLRQYVVGLEGATGILAEAARVLGGAKAKKEDTDPPNDEPRNNGASAGGRGSLGTQLDLVAGLVEMGVPTRAYSVSLGGFDTHANERGTQQRLLTELDGALAAFAERMGRTDRGRNVVVLVYSEFGRRVRANASDGTDHGTAGPAFVLGDKVNGGFHGTQPSLTDLDNGDLKETTDFRDVYATLLHDVLSTDPGPILNDHPGRMDDLFTS
ncbi:DUF1501 domain-containing protein, partial [Kibdelosporangium lantanae]